MNQDKTTNKVAICSAIFAGFAYVGYAVVKQVFGRGRREEEAVIPGGLMGFFRDETDVLGLDYEPADPTGRVFLRRLSGSRAGRGGTLLADAGESVLRPLSVRERIRQLNLSAVAFTDTLLVLHGLKPRQSRMSSSLPSSAFHSPTRILSPIDLQLEFLNRDEEEEEKMLEGRDSNDNYSVSGTPGGLSRRSSRRNLARRSLANSLANSVVSLSQAEQEEADSRAETLCQEREEELTRRLEGFQSSKPRELTPYEGRSLVALLHCDDRDKIARTLVTISNCAAFTRNQCTLREAGVLVRLPALLATEERRVQLAAAMAAANLALNTANMKEMEQVVLVLVLLAEDPSRDSELLCQLLLALTNVCVLADWHQHLEPLLPRLLDIVHARQERAVTLQALRLLVNLACNDEMAAALLGSFCPEGLASLLLPPEPEERILRAITLLANLAMAAQRTHLTNQPSGDGSLQRRLFLEEKSQVLAAGQRLMAYHHNGDVRGMASKLVNVLETC